jgi:nucleoside-diphosphate-sugar epimerase
MNILVAGAGGFIGGHLARRLLAEGHDVCGVDIKPEWDWYQLNTDYEDNYRRFCLDLRDYGNCIDVTRWSGAERVYNLAADMGGMGFIATHRVDCMQSALVTINILRAADRFGVDQVFYSSSACVYNDKLQQDTEVSLKEDDAWPADPEPGYGMEKLFGEEIAKFYREETGLRTVVARFHNIFGPNGTFAGGREKAPAAICRKVIEAKLSGNYEIEIWGDGEQTRSFLYVDECLEGVQKMIDADVDFPLNLGSSELVSINDLVSMVEDIAGIKLHRNYDLSAPQGVRGRNSDNTKIQEVLGWTPTESLYSGLEKTYEWIYNKLI